MKPMQWQIRQAAPDDVPAIFRLVKKLAEYEKLLHAATATEADFREALFGPRPAASALVASAEHATVGFALYFYNFSTFLGRRGIYLEDIFVEPAWRGKGIGSALLRHLAKIAKQENCGRVEWAVLTWNQPAIDFYHRLGAVTLEDWRIFRLTGEALDRVAAEG
jgi:GNAT superfamily N-acetyltransferase